MVIAQEKTPQASPTETPAKPQNNAVQDKATYVFKRILKDIVRQKQYPAEVRDQQLIYRKLIDHLDDIESRNRNYCKYWKRMVLIFIFCGLTSFLACSLAVEPTNHWRLLRLRIWQWITMAMALTGVFSVVPFLTYLLSVPFTQRGARTHKYRVYFIRNVKGSVDVLIWACLVLAGWYIWFRPRLKHVNGEISVIACQQTTRFLIALCIGAALWCLKNALFRKLEADLHFDQLFDRIRVTIIYMNGLWILRNDGVPANFLAYDEQMVKDFSEYAKAEKWWVRGWKLMRYMVRRKWKNLKSAKWSGARQVKRLFAEAKRTKEEEMQVERPKMCHNIWMDVQKMTRETVPITILRRLAKEYLLEMSAFRPRKADELLSDDQELLKEAKKMFNCIIGKHEDEGIDQNAEISRYHLENANYKLSVEELDQLFKLKLSDDDSDAEEGDTDNDKQAEEDSQQGNENKSTLNWPAWVYKHCWGYCERKNSEDQGNVDENKDAQPEQQANSSTEQAEGNKNTKKEKKIEVDRFLNWAVRAHKHCLGLEHTLKSSRKAFLKLNRMLSTFLIVLVAIIWLLLSRIVNTGQLALLFAPFLAVSFMFENSSKNMFHGIIFAFAMHPFDVGDRVIIDDMQMRVKEVNILTSVFYKYDTGAEVIFPNSKLATTKIVNLDITPDQSDQVDFLIDGTHVPLEDVRDLEVKIQKSLDDDLDYASGTKVVKQQINNPDKPQEYALKITVHFKYLVSYLSAEKKAERRSQILTRIMGFLKPMETEKIIGFPLNYKPYILEFSARTKKMDLKQIDGLKGQILKRLKEKDFKHRKVVLTHLDNKKLKLALYASNDKSPKAEKEENEDQMKQAQSQKGKEKVNPDQEEEKQDQSQKSEGQENKEQEGGKPEQSEQSHAPERQFKVDNLIENTLEDEEVIKTKLTTKLTTGENFFTDVASLRQQFNFTDLKVERDGETTIYPSRLNQLLHRAVEKAGNEKMGGTSSIVGVPEGDSKQKSC